MPVATSLNTIRADEFGLAEARHLLRRAGFGDSQQQVQAIAQMGLAAAVDHLVDYRQVDVEGLPQPSVDPDVLRPPTQQEQQLLRQARQQEDKDTLDRYRAEQLRRQGEDRRMYADLQQWWLTVMCQTPRPLQENLTLLWHSHFATRYRNVRDAYLMFQQNQLFRLNANRSFARLAAGIVRDPAMIRFLNNDRNVRQRPNENLARELMELFTLGEGQYTENDIKQAARALTGYHLRDNDFVFRQQAHDAGEKAILGRRGEFDGDTLVQLLLRQPTCSQFVAYKLYRHFVADLNDPMDADASQQAVILQLARLLRRHDFDIARVLKVLFRSRHFYDPAIVGSKIKSPTQLLVGTVRTLGLPQRDGRVLSQSMAMMGQSLLDPPSVAGWDIGRHWVNTSTLFVRQNLCAYLITGKPPAKGQWNRNQLGYDPMTLVAELSEVSPPSVVDHLVDVMMGEHISAARRQPLVKFMQQRDKGVTADSIVALLLLITAMPEYQLC